VVKNYRIIISLFYYWNAYCGILFRFQPQIYHVILNWLMVIERNICIITN